MSSPYLPKYQVSKGKVKYFFSFSIRKHFYRGGGSGVIMLNPEYPGPCLGTQIDHHLWILIFYKMKVIAVH